MICNECGANIGQKTVCPYCGASSTTQNNVSQVQINRNANDLYENNINGTLEITAANNIGAGRGTGILLNTQGYALTNAHVVTVGDKLATYLEVKVASVKVKAQIVALANSKSERNPEDLAIIKLENFPLTANPLTLGDSRKIKNGDAAYIIGNSLGDGLCITRGIISDKSRMLCGQERIMTDTAMNPGNSGGPLFNLNGKVVGVCVSVRTTDNYIEGYAIPTDGMKYCIPINRAKEFLREHKVKFSE